MENEHIVGKFDDDLDRIKNEILEMGNLVKKQIQGATKALLSFDENDVDDDTKDYATESNTRDFNSLNKKLDLDKLLKKDNTEQEEENRKVNSSKTLEELEELLNKAKKEGALKTGKKISEYSPAEAQKATYQLINTTDQLKQTVEGL